MGDVLKFNPDYLTAKTKLQDEIFKLSNQYILNLERDNGPLSAEEQAKIGEFNSKLAQAINETGEQYSVDQLNRIQLDINRIVYDILEDKADIDKKVEAIIKLLNLKNLK